MDPRRIALFSLVGFLLLSGCGSDPEEGSSCPVRLMQDGVLDVDLRSIRVSGLLSSGGAPLPPAAASRGTVSFREKRTQSVTSFDLGTSAAGRYDLVLAPSEYEVLFTANDNLCRQGGGALPCNSGVLKSAVRLTESGALDLDLSVGSSPTGLSVVSGGITVNGSAIPAAYLKAAAITFRSSTGQTRTTGAADSATFLGPYQLTLQNDTYDVFLEAPAACMSGSPLPCVSGPIQTGISIRSSGVLDLDIKTVRVMGSVSVNAQPVAAGNIGLGALAFRMRGGGEAITDATNSGRGLAPYSLTLLKGIYEIRYVSRNSACVTGAPCVDGMLRPAAAIQGDGAIDVNIPVVTTQGTVTVGGQPVVSANETGSLVFRSADGSTVLTAATGLRQLGAYRLQLLPGMYSVSYTAQSQGCGTVLSRAPCAGGPLKTGVPILSGGQLDLDVPVAAISGRITQAGTAVPLSSASRGRVRFQLQGGESVETADLKPYALRLLPGTYAISYEFTGDSCQMGETVPCTPRVLHPAQMLSTSGTLDLDLATGGGVAAMVSIRGRVTLDGRPLPTIAATRGRLLFMEEGGTTVETSSFGSSGAVSYQILLPAGRYTVVHQSGSSICSRDTGPMPCVSQIVAGACMP